MRVLVVGGGAREHALCWRLLRSRRAVDLFCAPGNAGTAQLATNVPINADSIAELVDWAGSNDVRLTVVGPEAPLAAGLVDALEERELRAFGPTASAAQIEASKCWSAGFLERHRVPAPRARICDDIGAGMAAIYELGLPSAIKADGLAAGKGVYLPRTGTEAEKTLDWLLNKKGLGPAGERVVVQEFLEGRELSVLALSDAQHVAIMPPARDFKRALDGDAGPNTGGMGAFSSPSLASPELLEAIKAEILEPTVRGMAEENRPFRGVLYAGLMLTADGPKVLEFNCRFGDPETQVILPLLETDLLDALEAVAEGELRERDLGWLSGAACGVVMVSDGYPGSYSTGHPIQGLGELGPDDLLFQAGTAHHDGQTITAGGRVLTATGVASDLESARRAAYNLVERINFEGCYYRRDIGVDDE